MNTQHASGRAIGEVPAHYSALAEGEYLVLVAPTIHNSMTGAWRCTQDNRGLATLHYVDGTAECVQLNRDVREIPGEWLGLVSAIQAKRGGAR